MPNYNSNYYYRHTMAESFLSLDSKAALQIRTALQPNGESCHSLSDEICQKVTALPVMVCAFQFCFWPIFWHWITLSHVLPLFIALHWSTIQKSSTIPFNMKPFSRIISSSKEKHTQVLSVDWVSNWRKKQNTICRERKQINPQWRRVNWVMSYMF